MTSYAADVKAGKVSLLTVVQSLGQLLTHTEDAKRVEGMKSMATMLAQFADFEVDRKSVGVLAAFFADRLSDPACVLPCLEAITALVQFQNVSSPDIVKIATSFMKNVSTQMHAQQARLAILSMVNLLLQMHLASVVSIGPEFAFAYTQLMDGEKDPRNLLMALKTARLVAANFPLDDALTQEIFDVVSCYFPITFTPPPNDPFNVSPDDLREELCKCLYATPAFGPFVLPLVLEKLQAASAVVKKDSLELLQRSVSVFGAAHLAPLLKDIRDILLEELQTAPDAETEHLLLSALASVARTLAKDGGSSLAPFVQAIVMSCKAKLDKLDTKLGQAACRLLAAIASSSDSACSLVGTLVLADLLKTYASKTSPAQRNNVLEALHTIISGARAVTLASDDDIDHPLSGFAEELLQYAVEAATSTDAHLLHRVGLSILFELMDQSKWISDEKKAICAGHLKAALLQESDEAFQQHASKLVVQLAKHNPALFKASVLPTLVESLNATTNPDLLETVVACAKTSSDLWGSLLGALLSIFVQDQQPSTDAVWIEAVLLAINDICLLPDSAGPARNIALTLANWSSSKPQLDKAIVVTVGSVLSNLVRVMSVEEQQLHLATILCQNGPVPAVPQWASNAPLLRRPNAALYPFLLGPMRSEVAWPADADAQLVEFAQGLVQSANDEDHQLFASLVNKRLGLVPELEVLAESIVPDASKPLGLRFWTLKALALRAHPKLSSLLKATVQLLDSDDDSAMAVDNRPAQPLPLATAKQFAVLLSDDGVGLSKQDFAVIKPLYKQRVLGSLKPELIKRFQTGPAPNKAAVLLTLAGLLRSVPQQLLVTELPEVLPLVLQMVGPLSTEDATSSTELHLAALKIFLAVPTGTLIEHVGTLIPASLRLATATTAVASSQVKVAAIELLRAFSGVTPYHHIHPFRQQVINSLGIALDDAKRAVRRAAADCRTRWLNL